MPMLKKPSKREFEELCRIIYGLKSYDRMALLSPTLKRITEEAAMRIWKWHVERLEGGGLL